MKTTINVTDRHIDRGHACSSRECAIAIALEELIPCMEFISVGKAKTTLRVFGDDLAREFQLPVEAQYFIRMHDVYKLGGHVGERPQPFSFELDLPEHFFGVEKEQGGAVCALQPARIMADEVESESLTRNPDSTHSVLNEETVYTP